MDQNLTGTAVAVFLGFIAIVGCIFLPSTVITKFGYRIIIGLIGVGFTLLGVYFSK
ncbi:MAG: hypothetical protein PHR26_03470 [Candidatus ainarchaeum sp.]|nr:hypothetical protein [Candidatus ainarchaeum sp.]MDD3976429.1 hypothetical protein [Candidatus ainarchaeum sp.]